MNIAAILMLMLLTNSFVPDGNSIRAAANALTPAPITFWNSTGSLNTARHHHTATLLPDGKVLVVGGFDSNGISLATAELYDQTSETWTFTGSLQLARASHAAMLLPNGKVLVVGGSGAETSAELYDPIAKTWSLTGSLNSSKQGSLNNPAPGLVLLLNGKVLVVGGGSAELYEPTTRTWTLTGSPHITGNAATLLADGRVLLVSRASSPSSLSGVAELYDPATGLWTPTGNLNNNSDHSYEPVLTRLPNGKVLAVGGQSSPPGSSELYDPTSGTWTSAITNFRRQYGHTTILLSNGEVLLIGGVAVTSTVSDTYLYNSQSEMWHLSGSLNTDRYFHTSTLLPNGKVLVAGGAQFFSGTLASAELYSAYTISGHVSDGANGLNGVTVSLSGSQNTTTITDTSGNYSFTDLQATGNYTVTPSRANYIFTPPNRSFTNLGMNQLAADFTATPLYRISGHITTSNNAPLDNVIILLSGTASSSTVSDSNGNFSFNDLIQGGDYVITPAKTNYTFTPALRTFVNISADQTANFSGLRPELLLEEGTPNRAVALDSVLFLRDPFVLTNPGNPLNLTGDKNTRVLVFVANLQLQPGDASSNVVVNGIDMNNVSYDIPASDVRLVPNQTFSQVTFRLPDGISPGALTITLTYRGQSTNSGVIQIH